MTNPDKPLKYLFTATFEDGKVIQQTPEDRSVLEPEKRSAYYDVVQEQAAGNKLAAFVLRGKWEDGTEHQYGVDLRDGHFEVDGVQFFMRQSKDLEVDPMTVSELPPLAGFRLVYFRDNRRHLQAQVSGGVMHNPTQVGHDVVHNFGWQTTSAGRNFQEIMQLA